MCATTGAAAVAVAAAVFGFNLSLGIFRRRCKVSDEIEILSIAACSKAAPPQPAPDTRFCTCFFEKQIIGLIV